MVPWNHILVLAGLVALGPSGSALSEPRPAAASGGAAEDALLLRLGDALAPASSAEANAVAIGEWMRAELRGCGAVDVRASSVSVSAPGCRLSNGLQLSRPLDIQVSRSARGLTVVLTSEGKGVEKGALSEVPKTSSSSKALAAFR